VCPCNRPKEILDADGDADGDEDVGLSRTDLSRSLALTEMEGPLAADLALVVMEAVEGLAEAVEEEEEVGKEVGADAGVVRLVVSGDLGVEVWGWRFTPHTRDQ